jgi:hypothetical protein
LRSIDLNAIDFDNTELGAQHKAFAIEEYIYKIVFRLEKSEKWKDGLISYTHLSELRLSLIFQFLLVDGELVEVDMGEGLFSLGLAT